MRRLFGFHTTEFTRRKDILSIPGSGNGRPPSCDECTGHQVWKPWNDYQALPEQERFIKIAEKMDLDLHLIWSALREHIDN